MLGLNLIRDVCPLSPDCRLFPDNFSAHEQHRGKPEIRSCFAPPSRHQDIYAFLSSMMRFKPLVLINIDKHGLRLTEDKDNMK